MQEIYLDYDKLQFNIEITDVITSDEIYECYRSTALKLEQFYKKAKNELNGDDYFWSYVGCWQWHRHDNITGSVKRIYCDFLIEKLRQKGYKIIYLKNGITKKIHNFGKLSSAPKLLNLLINIVKINFVKNNVVDKEVDVLLFRNENTSPRLGDIYNDLKIKYNVQEFHMKDALTYKAKKLKSVYTYISLSVIVKALFHSIKQGFLFQFKYKDYKVESVLIKPPGVYEFFLSYLHFFCVKSTIKKLKPKKIIYQISVNGPFGRRIAKAALSFENVETINLIMKPFPENSIPFVCGLDDEDKKMGMADRIIVINNYHKELLSKRLNKEIFIQAGWRDKILNNTYSNNRKSINLYPHLLIILGVNDDVNLQLIKDVLEYCSCKVAVKAHPTMYKDDYFRDERIVEVVDNNWRKIVIPNKSLAITVESSAAMEVIKYGGKVLWTPFYSLGFVVNYYFMNDTGMVMKNKIMLKEFFENYESNENLFDDIFNRNVGDILVKYLPVDKFLDL